MPLGHDGVPDPPSILQTLPLFIATLGVGLSALKLKQSVYLITNSFKRWRN